MTTARTFYDRCLIVIKKSLKWSVDCAAGQANAVSVERCNVVAHQNLQKKLVEQLRRSIIYENFDRSHKVIVKAAGEEVETNLFTLLMNLSQCGMTRHQLIRLREFITSQQLSLCRKQMAWDSKNRNRNFVPGNCVKFYKIDTNVWQSQT